MEVVHHGNVLIEERFQRHLGAESGNYRVSVFSVNRVEHGVDLGVEHGNVLGEERVQRHLGAESSDYRVVVTSVDVGGD